jgi:hypothetical protein
LGGLLFCTQVIFEGNIANQPIGVRKYPILHQLGKIGFSDWTQYYITKEIKFISEEQISEANWEIELGTL